MDADEDGIPDELENRLLATFRPYYRFSKDGRGEVHAPTDALWFVRRSELQKGADENKRPLIPKDCGPNQPFCLSKEPQRVLLALQREEGYFSSNLCENPKRTYYRINVFNEYRGGAPWTEVRSRRNVGLYGHVAPTRDGRYSIEYYQFFAYNSTGNSLDIGDHEGDWTVVVVVYDPQRTPGRISVDGVVRVTHWAHGKKMTFQMRAARSSQTRGAFKEFRGPNFDTSGFDIASLGFPCSGNARLDKAQDNLIRFYRDPSTGEFSHPVAYVENGGHEFWPSEHWSFPCAPKHGGDGEQFLTATPPNLGEVERPFGQEAEVILRFNGYWGGWWRMNSSPPGPALHESWEWPANSRLRPRILDSSFE